MRATRLTPCPRPAWSAQLDRNALGVAPLSLHYPLSTTRAQAGVALIEAAFTLLVLVVILTAVAAFLTLFRTPLAQIEGADAKRIFLSKPAPICELLPTGGVRPPASSAIIDATLVDIVETMNLPGVAGGSGWAAAAYEIESVNDECNDNDVNSYSFIGLREYREDLAAAQRFAASEPPPTGLGLNTPREWPEAQEQVIQSYSKLSACRNQTPYYYVCLFHYEHDRFAEGPRLLDTVCKLGDCISAPPVGYTGQPADPGPVDPVDPVDPQPIVGADEEPGEDDPDPGEDLTHQA